MNVEGIEEVAIFSVQRVYINTMAIQPVYDNGKNPSG
jgi:hypothetical protein